MKPWTMWTQTSDFFGAQTRLCTLSIVLVHDVRTSRKLGQRDLGYPPAAARWLFFCFLNSEISSR
jgi:hypothetical protein